MHYADFQTDVDPIIDFETGYAINLPLGWQDYPGWQNDRPDVVERINALRVASGIYVANDFWMEPRDEQAPVDILQAKMQEGNIAMRVAEIMALKERAKSGSAVGPLAVNAESNQE